MKSFSPRADYMLQADGLVLSHPQVGYHLAQWEKFGSLRKYLRCLDELLFLNSNGLPISPAPQPSKTSLSVVKKKA